MFRKSFICFVTAIASSTVVSIAEVPDEPNDWVPIYEITVTASGSQWGYTPEMTLGPGMSLADPLNHVSQFAGTMWNSPSGAGLTNPHPGTVPCGNWVCYRDQRHGGGQKGRRLHR